MENNYDVLMFKNCIIYIRLSNVDLKRVQFLKTDKCMDCLFLLFNLINLKYDLLGGTVLLHIDFNLLVLFYLRCYELSFLSFFKNRMLLPFVKWSNVIELYNICRTLMSNRREILFLDIVCNYVLYIILFFY